MLDNGIPLPDSSMLTPMMTMLPVMDTSDPGDEQGNDNDPKDDLQEPLTFLGGGH